MSLDSPADRPLRIRSFPWSVDIRGKTRRPSDSRIADYALAPDDQLVKALEFRDQRALETLYDRYGDYVYSVCLRMVSDVQLAEDLTQEVFLRLWRRPDLYDVSRGRFVTWLLSVARNRGIDERRSRGRRFKHENPPSLAAEEMLNSAPADEGADIAVLSEERVVIEKALATLPAEQRLAIQLAYFGGYTQQEIASGLSQPLGTVKTRIRLGLQKLRLVLIDQRDGEPVLVNCDQIREDLEAFALGALEPAEARRIFAHLHECPECTAFSQTYQEAIDYLALSVPLYRASPRLKDRILGGIGAIRAPTYISMFANRWVAGSAAAALVLLAVGALSWAIMLSNEVDKLQKDNRSLAELSQLDADQRSALLKLQGDLNSARTEQRSLSRTLEEQANLIVVALDPDLIPTNLEGTNLAPQSKCSYVWSSKQSVGALSCKDLPTTAFSLTYELWATKGDKTLALGSFQPRFDGSASLLVKFPADTPGSVANLWVTLEQQQNLPRNRPSSEIVLNKVPESQAAR